MAQVSCTLHLTSNISRVSTEPPLLHQRNRKVWRASQSWVSKMKTLLVAPPLRTCSSLSPFSRFLYSGSSTSNNHNNYKNNGTHNYLSPSLRFPSKPFFSLTSTVPRLPFLAMSSSTQTPSQVLLFFFPLFSGFLSRFNFFFINFQFYKDFVD